MAELICPQGRRYQVTSRRGERLFLLDEADQFRFVLTLSRDRVARGWQVTGDGPKRDRQQRDRSQRRKG
jgi:hypothetical protein